MRPRVWILAPRIGLNALGRPLLLADLLRDFAEPRLVGRADQNGKIWAPAGDYPIEILPHSLAGSARALKKLVSGDRLVVSKALPQSLGLTLLANIRTSAFVLDLDDLEVAFAKPPPWPQKFRRKQVVMTAKAWRNVTLTHALDIVAARVPKKTVVNRFLQRRYGGELLPHVRDPAQVNPSHLSALKSAIGLPGERAWAGFVGSVKSHKGLSMLVDALAQLSGPGAPGLIILGIDERDPYCQEVIAKAMGLLGSSRFRWTGTFPLSAAPLYFSIPDILVIPSLPGPRSRGQLPMKLFDGMAASRAIVTTDATEAGDILGSAGKVVSPDPSSISRAIDELAQNGTLREQLGRAAHQVLCDRYTRRHGAVLLRRLLCL